METLGPSKGVLNHKPKTLKGLRLRLSSLGLGYRAEVLVLRVLGN